MTGRQSLTHQKDYLQKRLSVHTDLRHISHYSIIQDGSNKILVTLERYIAKSGLHILIVSTHSHEGQFKLIVKER